MKTSYKRCVSYLAAANMWDVSLIYVAALLAAAVFAGITAPVAADPQPVVPDEKFWIPNGPVYSTVRTEDSIYLGGRFEVVGPNAGHGVVFEEHDGVFPSLPALEYPRFNGDIYASCSDGEGGWFVAGDFNYYTSQFTAEPGLRSEKFTDLGEGAIKCRIAHLKKSKMGRMVCSGTDLHNIFVSGPVYALAFHKYSDSHGRLFVGGKFNTVTNCFIDNGYNRNETTASNFFAVDMNNSDATTITMPISFGENESVRVFCFLGADLYIGGDFSGGYQVLQDALNDLSDLNRAVPPADPVYMFDPDYQLYPDLNRFWPPVGGSVHAMVVRNDDVYLGGDFIAGSVNPPGTWINLARVTYDRALYYPPPNPPLTRRDYYFEPSWHPVPNGPVDALLSAGALYAGGRFDAIDGHSINYLARFYAGIDMLDPYWSPFTSECSCDPLDFERKDLLFDGPGVDVLEYTSYTLYIGGAFTAPTRNLAAYSIQNHAFVSTWQPNTDRCVHTISISEGKMFVGGAFNSVNVEPHRNLVRLDAETGKPDENWIWEPNYRVRKLVYDNNTGYLYACGDFSHISHGDYGYNAFGLVRFEADGNGNLDLGWIPRIEIASNPPAIYPCTPGRVRTMDLDVVSQPNRLWIGGDFNQIRYYGSTTVMHVNNLTFITTYDEPVPYQIGTSGIVHAILCEGSNTYVGGEFTEVAGNSACNLAKFSGINFDWPGTGINYAVTCLETYGNMLYVGGSFTTPRALLARFDKSNGVHDSGYFGNYVKIGEENSGQSIRTIACKSRGSDYPALYIGGNFTECTENGVAHKRAGLAMIELGATPTLSKWNPSAFTMFPIPIEAAEGAIQDGVRNIDVGEGEDSYTIDLAGDFNNMGVTSAKGFAVIPSLKKERDFTFGTDGWNGGSPEVDPECFNVRWDKEVTSGDGALLIAVIDEPSDSHEIAGYAPPDWYSNECYRRGKLYKVTYDVFTQQRPQGYPPLSLGFCPGFLCGGVFTHTPIYSLTKVFAPSDVLELCDSLAAPMERSYAKSYVTFCRPPDIPILTYGDLDNGHTSNVYNWQESPNPAGMMCYGLEIHNQWKFMDLEHKIPVTGEGGITRCNVEPINLDTIHPVSIKHFTNTYRNGISVATKDSYTSRTTNIATLSENANNDVMLNYQGDMDPNSDYWKIIRGMNPVKGELIEKVFLCFPDTQIDLSLYAGKTLCVKWQITSSDNPSEDTHAYPMYWVRSEAGVHNDHWGENILKGIYPDDPDDCEPHLPPFCDLFTMGTNLSHPLDNQIAREMCPGFDCQVGILTTDASDDYCYYNYLKVPTEIALCSSPDLRKLRLMIELWIFGNTSPASITIEDIEIFEVFESGSGVSNDEKSGAIDIGAGLTFTLEDVPITTFATPSDEPLQFPGAQGVKDVWYKFYNTTMSEYIGVTFYDDTNPNNPDNGYVALYIDYNGDGNLTLVDWRLGRMYNRFYIGTTLDAPRWFYVRVGSDSASQRQYLYISNHNKLEY